MLNAKWIRRNWIKVLTVGGLLVSSSATIVRAQNGNGRGNPFEGPPGLAGEAPGNAGGNDNGQAKGQGNGNKGGNGKKSGKDSLEVIAKAATGNAGTITPLLPGDDAANWRYVACLPNATSINETIPLEFRLLDANDHPGDSVDVEIDPVGRLSDLVSVPSRFTLLDNGSVATKNILVTANEVSDGAYTLNLRIEATPQRGVELSQRMVHVHFLVGKACGGAEESESQSRPPQNPAQNPQQPSGGTIVTTPPPAANGSGFFTDGEFNLLENCSGTDVTGPDGGIYTIVARPQSNVISSTNPGTFYLNWIWDNTAGPEKEVEIELVNALNLEPRGANAVHAAQFDANGFSTNEDNFDLVNEDGKPCGPAGPCKVKVAAGKKLWINWHLTFSGKGASAAGLSQTCGEGLAVSATARIKGDNSSTGSTTVNAKGFVK